MIENPFFNLSSPKCWTLVWSMGGTTMPLLTKYMVINVSIKKYECFLLDNSWHLMLHFTCHMTTIAFQSFIPSLLICIVYFDLRTGAQHAICWSKSFLLVFKQVFCIFPSLNVFFVIFLLFYTFYYWKRCKKLFKR